ncbi:MAG: UvrD-helicase domain-containing protein [Bacteroidales bacterium]|nr:UvrD-helicase domain-containing protein [Bacteroidales bacterium]
MGYLKILKASAGSGKTYSLTAEYLKLIEHDKDAYRHVLAVTFTNKATEEMKRRVIEELFKRSAADPVARERLIGILHNFSSFNISTIDRFFQQTMRAFAREIGKSGSYNIELDDDLVISEAVDLMIQELDLTENAELLDWLIQFSSDSIEEGRSWDVKGGINVLAKQMFKESFRVVKGEFDGEILTRKALRSYIDDLDKIIKGYEVEVTEIAKVLLSVLERHGLRSDSFKGGKISSKIRFYDKIANGDYSIAPEYLLPLTEDFTNWYASSIVKGNPSLFNSIESAYKESLLELVTRTINLQEQWIEHNSALLVRNNIYTLGILIDINNKVQRYSKDNNILLLSETTEILNGIIDGSDTPFIYEKIGTRYDHFMLDEFQDTSLMQWDNFKPLIKNSVASGNLNLVVGDIKQSIYRWRGSEWTLLNSEIYNDFSSDEIEERPLDENWRSFENIVNFNNRFFAYAAARCDILLGEDSKTAQSIYSDSQQAVCKLNIGREGHVKVKFVDNEDKKWKENVLEELPSQITSLLESGFFFSDIAILVRVNKEGVMVVNKLIECGFPVVSNESLLVSSSSGVRKIVSLLRYVNNPEDPVNATIAEFEEVREIPVGEIMRLPLYEMCEMVIELLSDSVGQSDYPYIQGFMDAVSEYLINKKPDLNSFLEWFDTKWDKLSLSTPDAQNAIRVMTVHKSKGLGMKAVIVPFFDLGLDHEKNPTIWCKPDRKPFNTIPYLPVSYKKDLAVTIFANDYLREREKAFVDNLNIAYVAFTRAKQELIVYAPVVQNPEGKDNGKSRNTLSGILYDFLKEQLDENMEYNMGHWSEVKVENHQGGLMYEDSYISVPPGKRLRLALKAGEFFDKESKRNYGVIMHNILSGVYTEEDLPSCVRKAVSAGEIQAGEEKKITEHLSSLLTGVRDRHWFDSTYKIYNEPEVLNPGGDVSRPDRVLFDRDKAIVIDFKFGDIKKKSHFSQVAGYVRQIEQISGTPTMGYLWYLESNEIFDVI